MNVLERQTGYIDPRIVRTRTAITDAFLGLLKQHSYEQITITAISQTANIGPATFHRHYRNLDHLLDSLLSKADDELTRRIDQQKTLYHEALALFCFIEEHPELYRLRFSFPESHPVRQAIRQAAIASLTDRFERHSHTILPFDISLDTIVAKTEWVIQFYLDHIGTYSPEQMADMHFDLILRPALATVTLRDGWILAPTSYLTQH